MIPIIGPTPNQGQSQSPSIQDNDSEEGEESPDADSSSSQLGKDVKLDLGNSGDKGVHEKTAEMVLKKNVQIQVEQRVSVSSSFSQNSSPNATQSEGVDAEQTARQIFTQTESLYAEFSAQSGKSQSETLDEFKQKVQEGIDAGFEDTRKKIGDNPSESIETLLTDVRTALEGFLKVFGNEGAEGTNTDESGQAEQSDQNQSAAEGRPNIPPGLVNNVPGQSANALTNFAG